MSEHLQEFVSSRGAALRVDRAAGVIRGVKILGFTSKNGRRYLAEALREAVALYEGAKVNVNHPRGGPLAPRDYQDRIGAIRGVALREQAASDQGGLFADLHYNAGHPLAEQLAWDAEHAPENVGLSHNVLAVTARQGDEIVVESITKVQSVDLVADPATTSGLFEEQRPPLSDITADQLQSHRPDLITTLQEPLKKQNSELTEQLTTLRETLKQKVQAKEQAQSESQDRCNDANSFVKAIT